MKIKTLRKYLLLSLALLVPFSAVGAPLTTPIVPGGNLVAITSDLATQYPSAYPLLLAWKGSGVTAVEGYDTGSLVRAELDDQGNPAGNDFPLVDNAALFVYSKANGTLGLGEGANCTPLNFRAGYNQFSHACLPTPFMASELLAWVGTATSISRLDTASGRWSTLAAAGPGYAGEDFHLTPGEGYLLYAGAEVMGWTSPVPVIGGLSPPAIPMQSAPQQIEVTGSKFLASSVVSLNGVDIPTSYLNSTHLTATVPTQLVPATLNLTVKNPDRVHQGGFFISTATSFTVSSQGIFLTPAATVVTQDQSGVTLSVSISKPAPVGGVTINLASSNSSVLSVPASVPIPEGASSATVALTPLNTGIAANVEVTVTAFQTGWTGGQATVTVKPKTAISLSPATMVTGLTLSYPLTVRLSDLAPAGGVVVSLSAAPAGIVSLPSSVIVPAGMNSAQVTVTGSALGSTIISATSAGLTFSGAPHTVTVVPIQNATYDSLTSPQLGVQVGPVATAPTSASYSYTPVASAQVGVQVGPVFAPSPVQLLNYGPLASVPVGVQVGADAVAATSVNATYTPVASAEVGVAVGPVVTGISPNHGAIGDNEIQLTISGHGLDAVTGIAFLPPAGMTLGTLSVAADGLSVSAPVSIATNAAVGDRTVLVTTASGIVRAAVGRSDIFSVTLPKPEIYSIQPLRSSVGQIVAMSISGKNFGSASSVDFTPSTGIVVSNPPTVSADGATVTVSFTIAADAALGNRVVSVTTPGGTTSAIASVTNTFSVTSASDPGMTHTSVSAEVGVLVQTTAVATTRDVPFGPTASLPVGVTVGSTITAITPASGNIGSSNVQVRALGVGLSSASGISFLPPDGITVTSFAIGGDGNPQVTIDIAANAPVAPRTVLVALTSGGYAQPTDAGSNQFRVTLPTPRIYSLQPIRAMVGQDVAMTIIGKNFGSASSVDFTPADGITVTNPPTVSADGTMITISLTIAANATLGNRVATVTTPGGTSTATASTANTFAVTADQGTTYTPLLSGMVGVLVSGNAGNNQLDVPYGPIASAEVGVMVTPTAAPTSQSIGYGPLVSRQIGIAVGGVFTGFAPAALEPGRTATFTLTGVGLDSATAIAVVPSDNLTVTSWTPAADGRSGTVTISAGAGTISGPRTLVPMAGATALASSAPGVDLLQIGYKPILNSISTTFPQSSVLAALNATVTLTLNGTHLQGVTKVEVFPADGIVFDTVPTWFSDGTGEHVSVTMVVAAGAQVGDRLVRLTTIYGSTSGVLDASNTLSVVLTVADNAPAAGYNNEVAAARSSETPALFGSDALTKTRTAAFYGWGGRRLDAALTTPLPSGALSLTTQSVNRETTGRTISSADMSRVSRGPPGWGRPSSAT
jgi:hypothetical protein